MLGNGTIFSQKEKDFHIKEETARRQKMKDAFLKLYLKKSLKDHGTTIWRTASAERICSEAMRINVTLGKPYSGVDKFFNNESAQKAFFKFIKYNGSTADETSISLLIRFDAITSSPGKFFSATFGLTINEENVTDKLCTLNVSQNDDVKSQTANGGTVFMESASRVKVLLLVAVTQ